MEIEDILSRFDGVRKSGAGWVARCPAHADTRASLSIGHGADGKILVNCFAGCNTQNILSAVNLSVKDLFVERVQRAENALVATYSYGKKLRKLKFRKSDGSKYCVWEHLDGGQWKSGRAGIDPGLFSDDRELVECEFLVEGEKDVRTLQKAGFAAVTLPDGASSKWRDEYTEALRGRTVYILPDNDLPGKKYAQNAAERLSGVAKAVYMLDLKTVWKDMPEKADISDMVAAHGAETAFNELAKLTATAVEWTEKESTQNSNRGLKTFSARELQNAVLPPQVFIAHDLLTAGLGAIAAPPKYGKSWFVLQLCLAVSRGEPFLGYKTERGGCLYLALEDTQRRLQDRMSKLLHGAPAPVGFDFSVEAVDIDNGLVDMLEIYADEHEDLKLVVVDTLQKVRKAAGRNESAYSSDYNTMTPLKKFADKRGLCLLVVHHLRKANDTEDPFNRISGTNGILGALDTAIVLSRKARNDLDTTMSITGRDIDADDKVITFDTASCKWTMRGSADDIEEQRARLEYDQNPIVQTIKKLIEQTPDKHWDGTASELLSAGKYIARAWMANTARELTSKIKALEKSLYDFDEIIHSTRTNGSGGAKHSFCYVSHTVTVETVESVDGGYMGSNGSNGSNGCFVEIEDSLETPFEQSEVENRAS